LTALAVGRDASSWWAGFRFSGGIQALDRARREAAVIATTSPLREVQADEWPAIAAAAQVGDPGAILPKIVPTTSVTQNLLVDCAALGDVLSYPTAGLIYLRLGSLTADATAALSRLRREVEAGGNALVLESAPNEAKREIGVWGATRADFPLMRAVKQQL